MASKYYQKSLHSDLRKGTVAEWIKALLLREKMYKNQKIQRVELIELKALSLLWSAAIFLEKMEV